MRGQRNIRVLCDHCKHSEGRIEPKHERKVLCMGNETITRVYFCDNFSEKEKPPEKADGISRKF